MKFNKFILNVLLTALFLNNTSSLASIVSEDGRYETFEGNDITIDNLLEESKVDVEIEGNTLVNMGIKKSPITSHASTVTIENGVITGVARNDYDAGFYFEPTPEAIDMMRGKEVTIFLYGVVASSDTKIRMYNRTRASWYTDAIAVNTTKKNLVFTATIPNDIKITDDLEIIIYNPQVLDSWIQIEDKLMILEGNWINKKSPNYFTGMKSVGESDTNNHKVEVSVKKTLYSVKNLYAGKYVDTNGEFVNDSNQAGSDFIKVISNKEVVSNLPSNTYIKEFDHDKNHIRTLENTTNFSTSESAAYITFNFHTLSPSNWISKNYIYLNYKEDSLKSNKKEIQLSEPLRGIGNVKDRIVKKDGQWCIERNVGQYVLNGSESWAYEFESIDNYGAYNLSTGGSHPIIKLSNRFPCNIDGANNPDRAGFTKTGAGYIKLYIPKLYLEDISINGFEEYLSKNNVKVLFELKTPIYEPINIDISIDLFKDSNHIVNDSVIPANMKVTVDRTLNRATEAIQEARINPTPQNISVARMWANLLEDSALKDEIQQEISDIVVSEDIEMERKSVSSNMDVYIRSENVLSMSLSTNSVIFEDYSGVDDNEKLNAVDVIVSSSLPYALNTYLETPIESNSGNVISNTVLSIRESGGAYQSFSNTDSKIILNNDCESAESKSHSIDLKVSSDKAINADVYKTTVKFEAIQK
ncbi:MAG: hypothetical protein IJ086_00680 [Clostridium sp.]|nr:hypothetical protein [Clostridium sp.]